MNNNSGLVEPLTEAEALELEQRIVGSTGLTEDQLVLRLQIAQKICRACLTHDETLTTEFKQIYKQYPMWGFYRTKDGGIPKRVYGVMLVESGDKVDLNDPKHWRLHTASSLAMFTNLTVGGTPALDLERVDRWSVEDVERIALTGNPGSFLDPLGFLCFLLC